MYRMCFNVYTARDCNHVDFVYVIAQKARGVCMDFETIYMATETQFIEDSIFSSQYVQ
jgi:hypothetical protein